MIDSVADTLEVLNPSFEHLFSNQPFHQVKTLSESGRSVVLEVYDVEQKIAKVLKYGTQRLIANEAECLKKLSHPNIVSLLDHFSSDVTTCIVLEKIEGDCIVDLLANENLNEEEVSLVISQIVAAVTYLHNQGWVHRDLKPDNIIYNRTTKTAKLIDFEFASKFYSWWKLSQKIGTPEYASPEVRKGSYWGPEIDVWSLGITMYVMLTGEFPFLEDELKAFKEQFQPVPSLSENCNHLLSKMLETDPSKRATLKFIQEHPWIKNLTPEIVALPETMKKEETKEDPISILEPSSFFQWKSSTTSLSMFSPSILSNLSLSRFSELQSTSWFSFHPFSSAQTPDQSPSATASPASSRSSLLSMIPLLESIIASPTSDPPLVPTTITVPAS